MGILLLQDLLCVVVPSMSQYQQQQLSKLNEYLLSSKVLEFFLRESIDHVVTFWGKNAAYFHYYASLHPVLRGAGLLIWSTRCQCKKNCSGGHELNAFHLEIRALSRPYFFAILG
jgi:hypothetical protein